MLEMSLDVYLDVDGSQVYWANITHNLGKMAEEAGIYKHLWRPEELEVTKAKDLIEPLREGLCAMVKDPKHFRQFDSDNGWGTYGQFLPFVIEYLEACIDNPNAAVSVSR
jgi:hypothetical protein